MSHPQEFTAIEIKSAKKWDKRWNDPLIDFKEKSRGKVKKLIGIYRGSEILNQNDIEILPAEVFLTRLAEGKVL